MEIFNQLLAHEGITGAEAQVIGAIIIALVTVAAARGSEFLGTARYRPYADGQAWGYRDSSSKLSIYHCG